MLCYILDHLTPYEPQQQTKWHLLPGVSIEQAIIEHAGKNTLMVQWSEGDGIDNQIVIPTNEDNNRLADKISSRIFLQLKSAIISSK